MNYTLIRSKRKTVAVYVADGKVTVKAPLKTSLEFINGFVAQKEKWIMTALRRQQTRKSKFDPYLGCNKFLLYGSELRLNITDDGKMRIADGTLFVPVKYCVGGSPVADKPFLSALKRTYVKLAQTELAAGLSRVASRASLAYSSFSLTNAKTKWGSCDAANRIKLNWRLILLPPPILEYVAVHELCHTLQHNHSKEFYNCVSKLYPEYKEAKAWLKEAGVLMQFLR